MRDFPPGWATDLAILEQSGSTVEDRAGWPPTFSALPRAGPPIVAATDESS